ncbi:AraC family transcriptional regulator [Haloplasma contractile]|uniref:Arginyl-tRNA synthetase protein n=1 Tax=Haloplasma contractile SSD-17B TaxID=1033810 RepID=U2FDT1_9MOLU|nr:AraC family transcriptional regulator [Haloplasma contractile]ERJ11140.1 arginyl-tRNA synthetase protein [Haloplasma contractile SSD-17B]
MEWLERMNDCIKYLEDHIEDKLDIDALASELYISKFHLQRLFHMLTGVTIGEYVRNRKLTLAAGDLTTNNAKVIEVAYKYGYESPKSFSRAFRKLHGVSPSVAKTSTSHLKAYPKMSFQIQLKGEQDMNYKLIEKESFKVVGKGLRTTKKDGQNIKNIPSFWEDCINNGDCQRIKELNTEKPMLGVCFNHDVESVSYYIAVEKPEALNECMFEVKTIPFATWAVFESIGPMPDAIQTVTKRIFTEWFPSTG